MTYAQHDHSSHGGSHTTHVEQPPNGGVIKEAGKYKIEMVANMFLKKDQLRFYLFKGNFRAILNEGITGTITIKSNDKKTSTQSLQAKGNDFFVAQLQNSGSFQATVKFIIKGKTVSTVFIQNGIGHHSSASYTCSMHPEVKSDTFGTCPKCGMNLEKQ
ncbi:MAG: hypothetical protein COA97_12520 [Flavobacteriales bacterium]|nr:MAG: hypothetical protein COA97_12520 [Flavobacteriales bacterium]